MAEDEERLFIQYQRAMTQRAMWYVRNIHDAEDVVSSAWLSLFQHMPTLLRLDPSARNAYVMRTVTNKAIDCLRREQSERQCVEKLGRDGLAQSQTDEFPLPARELLHGIRDVLTPRQRSVLALRLRGFSNWEIARILRVKPATVRTCWFQIRRQIRRVLIEK